MPRLIFAVLVAAALLCLAPVIIKVRAEIIGTCFTTTKSALETRFNVRDNQKISVPTAMTKTFFDRVNAYRKTNSAASLDVDEMVIYHPVENQYGVRK